VEAAGIDPGGACRRGNCQAGVLAHTADLDTQTADETSPLKPVPVAVADTAHLPGITGPAAYPRSTDPLA